MRILVAEDEKDMNRLITRTLEKEGYGVDSCYDGQEALDYLESAEYDGAILDVYKRQGICPICKRGCEGRGGCDYFRRRTSGGYA